MANKKYYLGLMSGTSADGIDLALVDFSSESYELIAHNYQPYDDETHNKITSLYSPKDNEIDRLSTLNVELSHKFAKTIKQFLLKNNIQPSHIAAIGNHGQTIRHRPNKSLTISHPFTLQIGCNQTLACLTDIEVIGDFRTKDMALGGQGAPLVPAFHQYLFANREQDTIILNLGGIANITYLPKDSSQAIIGFDTGPANALLDAWCFKCTGKRYDERGDWASQGHVHKALLEDLLTDNYFSLPAPKSTGREYFTLDWLSQYSHKYTISDIDIQATISALTVQTIINDITNLTPKAFVYLCGGGINNLHCYKQIKQCLSGYKVDSINSLKLNNNAFEAMAFAWLAFAYDKKIYGNIPTVTGANKQTILGSKFSP